MRDFSRGSTKGLRSKWNHIDKEYNSYFHHSDICRFVCLLKLIMKIRIIWLCLSIYLILSIKGLFGWHKAQPIIAYANFEFGISPCRNFVAQGFWCLKRLHRRYFTDIYCAELYLKEIYTNSKTLCCHLKFLV